MEAKFNDNPFLLAKWGVQIGSWKQSLESYPRKIKKLRQ